MKKDEYFMDIALKLALRGKGRTSPNPTVGALVVKDDKIIAKGFHSRAGGQHAEVIALNRAGSGSKDAKLYVTLEPCSHFGRTPPCVYEIMKKQIREVIIGMKDPNPVNNGNSIRILRKHGIKVKIGCLQEKLRKMNEDFIKYITERRPFITVKIAQSLDGKIALGSGDSKWITSSASRLLSHNLRKTYDAILVGINTVLKDNPELNCPDKNKRFFKIIVDSNLKIPLKAKIFSRQSRGQIIIATCNDSLKKAKIKILSSKGVTVVATPRKNGKVNLKILLRKLAKLEIMNILVEGGGRIVGSLFDEGLVDKVVFFIALKIIGGEEAISAVGGKGIGKISNVIRLKDVQIDRLGEDLLVEGYVYRNRRGIRYSR
jgi:diaminohydroxyphosphoribosylaminopyrimidine deaminase/5-amino-6-(5-phosphoribosylamino)uracil reductase